MEPKCEKCGKAGRQIDLNEGRRNGLDIHFLCPNCYRAMRDKEFHIGEWVKKATLEERKEYKVIEDIYLNPLFFGKKPDAQKLAKCLDKGNNLPKDDEIIF